MGETFSLFRAVLWKELVLMKRYPLNTLGAIIGLYGLFVLIFLGGRAVAGDRFNDSLGAIIVGYFLVTMAITAYQDLAGKFTREAQWGTLEQLFLSPIGFGRVAVMLAVSNIVVTLFFGSVILTLMLVTTGTTLQLDVLTIAPLVVLTLLSVLGVGFVFGGAAIRYKRVGNLFNLLQFAFFGLVAAPVREVPVLKLLPIAQGSYLLGQVMNEGVGLWEFPTRELAILAAVGIGYFLLGYLVFGFTTRRARKQGVMGHY